MRLRASAALLALAVLLAGCAPVVEVPPEPTGDELDRLIDLQLDLQWQYVGLAPDAPRPAVERVRIVPMSEAEDVHRQCMVDAGYVNYRFASAAIFGGASNAERVAIYTCAAKYPTPPASYALFSEAQLDFLYDFYIEVTVPCIESTGISVAGVPSREEFMQPPTYVLDTWVPYRELEGDLSYLAGTKCRYVPEGFPSF